MPRFQQNTQLVHVCVGSVHSSATAASKHFRFAGVVLGLRGECVMYTSQHMAHGEPRRQASFGL